MPGLPKFTRTVAVSVVVNPFVVTVKDLNRDFEKGDLSEWTAVDAEISETDPYEGDYSCNLTAAVASITQTLDDPMPVNAVSEYSCWVKRTADGDSVTLRMIYTDGTHSDASTAMATAEWERAYFPRGDMSPDKILSGIALISGVGDFFVDKVVLAIAAEVITGAVEVTQATAESLQATVTPADDVVFTIAQDTPEDLQVEVTPETDAEFTVVQDTPEALQVTVTPAAATEFEVVQATAEDLQAEATPKPKGGVLAKASDTTAGAFATIGSHTPGVGVTFQLAKILVSCPEDVLYVLRWNGTEISAEVYVTGGIPFVDWFPWDYYDMPGDNIKIFDVQVMYPAGGAAATCHVEIVGEDVSA